MRLQHATPTTMTRTQPLCLIIDPDDEHARGLQALCESKGFRVLCERPTPTIGNSALSEFAKADVAFIDGSLGIASMTELAEDALVEAELFAMAENDDTVFAESCIRAGFSFFFRKPFDEGGLSPLLEDIEAEVAVDETSSENQNDDTRMVQFGLMRGSSKGMRKLFRTLRKVGPTDTSILVVGESGTGKELVAETLHHQSRRSAEPYLTLNCSAIAENLIESELFGHEKGSFSGAQAKHRGFFERANGGTLFLDEITEMSIDMQAKLLRALESGEVRRVGSVEALKVDVRIVAATNRDPLQAVQDGLLREDLYYRLAHVTVHVPPLRRRGRDIVGLAQFFLRQLNERHGTSLSLSDDGVKKIESFNWPGNVRQLRHAVERAYIMSEDEINAEAFVFDEKADTPQPAADIPLPLSMPLAEAEKHIILANLAHNDDDKKKTAEVLGISLKTLYNRLRDYAAESGPVSGEGNEESD
jgi:two-component system response regulator AtoC